MSPLPTIIPGLRREEEVDFCEQMARHGDAMLAAVRSGLCAGVTKDPRMVAEQALARPEIKAGIEVFKAAMDPAAAVEITRDSVIADIESIFQDARETKDYGAALAAKKLQAALMGLLVNRQMIDVAHHRDPKEMTTLQLEAFLRGQKVIDVTPDDEPLQLTDERP
jgi:hypothetical protein